MRTFYLLIITCLCGVLLGCQAQPPEPPKDVPNIPPGRSGAEHLKPLKS